MGKALGEFCGVVERLRDMGELETPLAFEGSLLEAAVRDARALQASRDRLFFEIQILQITQGALKMEIDRLRAEAVPVKVYATDAIVTFGRDGVTLQAPLVEVHGDVTVQAQHGHDDHMWMGRADAARAEGFAAPDEVAAIVTGVPA